jgi:hypothetical protein
MHVGRCCLSLYADLGTVQLSLGAYVHVTQ